MNPRYPQENPRSLVPPSGLVYRRFDLKNEVERVLDMPYYRLRLRCTVD